MPLILVQNEITVDAQYEHWKDIEGVQYHFPNQYKNKINEGDSFIYYRGKRRANNQIAIPEYFGVGKIGAKRIDPESIGDGPKSSLQWFCDIVDYIPFLNPVSFKIADKYLEEISSNQWGVGVRTVNQQTFDRIIALANLPVVLKEPNLIVQKSLIALDQITPRLIDNTKTSLLVSTPLNNETTTASTQVPSPGRYSKYSKLYGERSEEIVYKVLTDRFEHRLRWVSKEGEKPGWDIEYHSEDNEIAVEVKGTSGKRFKNLEITAGEWRAAEKKREHYHLYLVADCLGREPLIQVVNNPYELYVNKKISLIPTSYRMSFNVALL